MYWNESQPIWCTDNAVYAEFEMVTADIDVEFISDCINEPVFLQFTSIEIERQYVYGDVHIYGIAAIRIHIQFKWVE